MTRSPVTEVSFDAPGRVVGRDGGLPGGRGHEEERMPDCRSGEADHQDGLPRPGPIAVGARIALALPFLGGAVLARDLPLAAVALGGMGVLLFAAGLTRQPGCEVNLLWSRLFRREPIGCVVFGPVDRWERRRVFGGK